MAVARLPTISDLLALFGPGVTVIGGVIGLFVQAPTWRRSFENLALGATAGGVCGCLVAFLAYLAIKLISE
ncbi:MAG TPA: hypothetical protein VES65_05120 [Solirubrobacteraceae bacterium]|nr:hypothetical protein [Solirubrobacteraceae bacterium]